jgi:hypothetical protein
MNRGIVHLLVAEKPIDVMDDFFRTVMMTNTLLSRRAYMIGQYMNTAYLPLRVLIRRK